MQKISSEEYRQLNKKRSKYGNRKTVVAGIVFDSKKEAGRYQELVLLQKSGLIHSLELQKKFILQEAFLYNRKKIQPIIYITDFYYFDPQYGCYVAEDVKGFKKDSYILKKKLFMCKFPDIYFLET